MTTATMKTDSQIKSDVLAELKWDPNIDETDVGVQVHDGVVTLTGNVTSYVKKLAACSAAHRVGGVLDVADDLVVKLSTPWSRTDEDLAKAVRNALKWDVVVPDERITSTVSNGNVTLQGSVDAWPQRGEAERVVQRLTGVRTIDNQISIACPIPNPARLRQDIEEALERQADREAKRINVAVHEGVVTLSGAVRTWAEKRAVEGTVEFAPGVRRLES